MGGGGSTITGYEYYGGIAQVICMGEITRLTRIANGDTEIWSGDVDQTSRDSDGKTALSTTLGAGYLYWGRSDQVANADLAAALIDFGTGPTTVSIPAWRHWALFVMPECAFGTQPNPPTLTFDFERRLDTLSISAHEIDGDAVLPEVIYDLLVDAVYSVGMDTSRIDSASFESAAEVIIAEALGVSPQIDQTTTLRDFLGTLLQYIDAFLFWDGGKIKMKLLRKESSAGAIAIDESALTDEPEIGGGSLADTWNFTRLVFTDRDNNWDDQAVEPYDDHANAAAQGENVPKDVELPFVTKRSVAKILARRRGIAGGVPQVSVQLRLLPSYRTLKPGDLITVTYAKLGLSNKLMRVMGRETGGSKNQEVVIDAVTELTRDESNDYVPPADPLFNLSAFYDLGGGIVGTLESSTARLLWLPSGLKEGKPDGALIAFSRPNVSVTRRQIWWTWDPNQKPYKKRDAGTEFPVAFTLRAWMRARNNTKWILRGEFASQDDADYVRELAEEGKSVYFVTARRLYKATGSAINQHQMDGLWCEVEANGRIEPVDGLLYDVEVSDEAFSSNALALETEAGQGNYPCVTCYAGREKDFHIWPMDNIRFERELPNGSEVWLDGSLQNEDTDLIRWFKVLMGTKTELQELADVTATTYDRDSTTMCPDGTLSNQWGSVVPTLYEAYDLAAVAVAFAGASPYDDLTADLDAALYAAVFGLATVEQQFVTESTEEVLAYMAQTGIQYYNKTTA